MIDALDEDVVDEGKRHPFVVALVRELKAKLEVLRVAAEAGAFNGMAADGTGRANNAAAFTIRDVIRMIETAKGRPE